MVGIFVENNLGWGDGSVLFHTYTTVIRMSTTRDKSKEKEKNRKRELKIYFLLEREEEEKK